MSSPEKKVEGTDTVRGATGGADEEEAQNVSSSLKPNDDVDDNDDGRKIVSDSSQIEKKFSTHPVEELGSSPPRKKQKNSGTIGDVATDETTNTSLRPSSNQSSSSSSSSESSDEKQNDNNGAEGDSSSTGPPPPPLPAGADSEVIELEIEDTSDDEALFRQIVSAAAARGIPLDFLAGLGGGYNPYHDDDDEDIEYPYDPPTSLQDVADFMKSDICKKILILSGAGLSVASGIPDFRSRDGFYATLNADLLSCTNPEQVEQIRQDPCYCLDQHLFLENPLPCLEVNREFILGTQAQKWKPTLAHRILTMTTSGKLCRWYTQNIDGLEDACCGMVNDVHGAGSTFSAKEASTSLLSPTPARQLLYMNQIIAVHGSMDRATCAVCRAEMDFDEFCNKVRTQIKDIKLAKIRMHRQCPHQ